MLFENKNIKPTDTCTLNKKLGPEAKSYLQSHYNTFYTEKDFENMAAIGFNCVRIPVGHWEYVNDPDYGYIYQAGLKYIDNAFEWAKNNGIWVYVDIHTAPSSQNNNDHSGCAGRNKWKENPAARELSVTVVENVAQMYSNKSNLFGVGVLNEPHGNSNGDDVILEFVKKAIPAAKKFLPDAWIIVDR